MCVCMCVCLRMSVALGVLRRINLQQVCPRVLPKTPRYVKGDLFVFKRDLFVCSKETYLYVKRDLFVCQKRPICMSKETYLYVKRDIFVCQKRHLYVTSATAQFLKSALYRTFSKVLSIVPLHSKCTGSLPFWEFLMQMHLGTDFWDFFLIFQAAPATKTRKSSRSVCQKRPICMSKETYLYVKRGLFACLKTKTRESSRSATNSQKSCIWWLYIVNALRHWLLRIWGRVLPPRCC